MFGHKIASIRVARGYTQDYMEEKTGIKQNIYSKIERNERKVDDATLQKIADTLGVSVDDIKSPTPIVMSFHNSNYNAPFGTQNNNLNDQLLKEILHQLNVKDQQIVALTDFLKGSKL